MRLEDLSFTSLQTLCVVHDLGSFSKAAIRLEKSQSSMSYTVDTMRKAFGDPLFVRNGAGVVPTERCEDIVRTARSLIAQFEQLGTLADFDPTLSEGTVRISCNYYERLTLLPALMRRLRSDAPIVRVEIIQATTEGEAHLKHGECDMFLSPMSIDSTEIYSKHLFDEKYVCVMAQDNGLATGVLDMATYAKAPHALVTYGGHWKSFYLRELEAKGITLNTIITIPSPASLQYLLTGTDLISTVPRRIAQSLGTEIKIVETPFLSTFKLCLYWSARTHNSAMHRWIRKTLVESIQENLVSLKDPGRKEL